MCAIKNITANTKHIKFQSPGPPVSTLSQDSVLCFPALICNDFTSQVSGVATEVEDFSEKMCVCMSMHVCVHVCMRLCAACTKACKCVCACVMAYFF